MAKSLKRIEKQMLKIARQCGKISIQTYFYKEKLIGEAELEAVEALVSAGMLKYSHVTFVNHPNTLGTSVWTKHFYDLV